MLKALVICLGITLPVQAFAVINQAVRDACRNEYLALCKGMTIPSAQLRSCFRSNMQQLSKTCLKSLADNKEATQADINKYLASNRKTND